MDRTWTDRNLDHGQGDNSSADDLEQWIERRTYELQETHRHTLQTEKLAALGRFSASVAHELNNPLQGILTVLGSLHRRAELSDEDRQLLEAALGESRRMRQLLRSLQEFARPSAGRRVVMDVHATLDGLLLLLAPDLEQARISVQRDYGPDLPRILADSDRIALMFESLVVNAIEACQGRGGTLTITTRRQGDRVSVAFTDTGVGMDEAEQAQVFQPFYTTKPAVKGTGLGLPVSHGIVRSHGGEIQVRSRPGQGATFTVILPVRGDAAEEGSRD